MNLPQRHRDTETEGKSDREMTRFKLSISASLRLSVSPSLWLCVSVASLFCLIASAAARVKIAGGGKWFIKFIHMTKLNEANLDYESKWASLTFEIR